MVQGVTQGFEAPQDRGHRLRAKLDAKAVVLTVGYANQITLKPPEGVTAEVPDPNTVVVKGADKQKVGQSPPRSSTPDRRSPTRARACI